MPEKRKSNIIPMKQLRHIVQYLLICISSLVILMSILSLSGSLTRWYFQVLDFPRLQYLVLAVVCLLAFCLLKKDWQLSAWLLVAGLVGTIVIQSTYLMPYWLGQEVVPDATTDSTSKPHEVGIVVANVLMTNRQPQNFLRVVREVNPDMVLTMEVDEWWVDQLKVLKDDYPYVMEYPLDNAYGIALYSRLPLEEKEIRFLEKDKVPSFHARVTLPGHRSFRFHGMHPVAPVPSEKYPDGLGEKGAALRQVGDMVAKGTLPSVVAGDFNDVSWSQTTRMFEASGKLGNVRLGRGLYNSFKARSYLQRWPLDHFFVTKEFALLELKKLPYIHSDHYPIYARLVLR